jgi:hypothetical protein
MAIGLFLTPFVHEPWQFYITYGLFGGFAAASIGVGVATMVLAPLAGWVVKVYGWRVGFVGWPYQKLS